jgi:ketosteroid isomerase-like protein
MIAAILNGLWKHRGRLILTMKNKIMKKIAVLSIIGICVLFLFDGCWLKNVNIMAEEDVIRKLEADWTIINKTKDIEKYIGMYASEAVIIAPNEPVCVGIEAIQAKIEAIFADTSAVLWDTYSWTSDKVEVSGSGDLAYVMGSNQMNIKTPNGIIKNKGRGVDIWKKINGEWKAVLSIWN